jgi:hypothetical protein
VGLSYCYLTLQAGKERLTCDCKGEGGGCYVFVFLPRRRALSGTHGSSATCYTTQCSLEQQAKLLQTTFVLSYDFRVCLMSSCAVTLLPCCCRLLLSLNSSCTSRTGAVDAQRALDPGRGSEKPLAKHACDSPLCLIKPGSD